MAFQGDSIYWVEVEKVVPNPFQPRREFDQNKLQELADSIRMYGVLQPLVVTVIVGTDARNVPRDYPTNIRVTAKETGLPIDTVFLCFQIRSIDPSRLHHPETHLPNLAGQMPTHRMADIDQAIKLVLNFN